VVRPKDIRKIFARLKQSYNESEGPLIDVGCELFLIVNSIAESLEVLAAEKTEPTIRYFFHPESDSLWTEVDGKSHIKRDGLVEEIDRQTFLKIQSRLAKDQMKPSPLPQNNPITTFTRGESALSHATKLYYQGKTDPDDDIPF
jgi:hypothetical protein